MVYCPNCGGKVSDKSQFCSFCGYDMKNTTSAGSNPEVNQQAYTENYQQAQPGYQQPVGNSYSGSFSSAPKDRMIAGILALLLGGLGVHKFYLGNIGMGILYLIFAWTGIPEIVGFIEGIIYLTKSDEEFYRDHVLPIEQQNAVRV
ncbi:MAG: NINE protein [Promethearchaeota archaeon]